MSLLSILGMEKQGVDVRLSLPVTVSLTQTATLSRIEPRTFLLITAAAKNSQSVLVYRCLLSSGRPYFWRTT